MMTFNVCGGTEWDSIPNKCAPNMGEVKKYFSQAKAILDANPQMSFIGFYDDIDCTFYRESEWDEENAITIDGESYVETSLGDYDVRWRPLCLKAHRHGFQIVFGNKDGMEELFIEILEKEIDEQD